MSSHISQDEFTRHPAHSKTVITCAESSPFPAVVPSAFPPPMTPTTTPAVLLPPGTANPPNVVPPGTFTAPPKAPNFPPPPANDANARFKRAQTTQAFGIT